MTASHATENSRRSVISLGGSLFVPDAIDIEFIRAFREIIAERVKAGDHFVIIVGGGKTCRRYQQAGRDLGAGSQLESDWIGIYVTRMHAEFMRIIFGDMADAHMITDPSVVMVSEKPVVFGAGWEPGWSTDYDAVMVARATGAKCLVNLTNINYVYDADPSVKSDAQPQRALSWTQYRSIIPKEWQPGLNTPFDPIASREAEKDGMKVVIMNGSKLTELKVGLETGDFDGTIIS